MLLCFLSGSSEAPVLRPRPHLRRPCQSSMQVSLCCKLLCVFALRHLHQRPTPAAGPRSSACRSSKQQAHKAAREEERKERGRKRRLRAGKSAPASRVPDRAFSPLLSGPPPAALAPALTTHQCCCVSVRGGRRTSGARSPQPSALEEGRKGGHKWGSQRSWLGTF